MEQSKEMEMVGDGGNGTAWASPAGKRTLAAWPGTDVGQSWPLPVTRTAGRVPPGGGIPLIVIEGTK